MVTATRDTILELFDFRHCGSADVAATAVYQNERIEFKVSSHALCFASQVWKKFLFPPFEKLSINPTDNNNESESDEVANGHNDKRHKENVQSDVAKEIDFSGDDGDALLILLQIAHLQFCKIPSRLTYKTLYQITILCDQYNCAPLVRPWLASWLKNEKQESLKDGCEGWLFIAWVFGRDTVFEDLACKLVRQVNVDHEGGWRSAVWERLPEPMPPGIAESILASRAICVDSLVAIPLRMVQNFDEFYLNNKYVCTEHAAEEKDRRTCDAMIYGLLILYLKVAWPGPWPIQNGRDIQTCINSLAMVVAKIGRKILSIQSHAGCVNQETARDVRKILSEIKSPVLESHRVHMRSQTEAIGNIHIGG